MGLVDGRAWPRSTCFRRGFDFVAGIWRKMVFHGHEVDNGAGFFYFVEEYRWGSPLRRSLVRGACCGSRALGFRGLLLDSGWRVSRCGSGDYGKRVAPMGSTWVQDVAKGQVVRRRGEACPLEGAERATQEISGKMVCRGGELTGTECVGVSDTGKTAEKGVSWQELAGTECVRVSDTGKTAKKGVSRMGDRGKRAQASQRYRKNSGKRSVACKREGM